MSGYQRAHDLLKKNRVVVDRIASVLIREMARNGSLDPLDDDRRGHAAGGAHGDQAALEAAALELVEHRADQDRAGRPDRMAERDRPAVDVDLVAVELEVAHELLGDHREGLVDLEEVDVVERHAGLGQHLARGRHRRVQHQGRAVADVGHRDDAGPRLQAVRLGVVGRRQQQRGRAVDDARRVAGVVDVVDLEVGILLQDQACEGRAGVVERIVGDRREGRLAGRPGLRAWSAAAEIPRGRGRACRRRDRPARGSCRNGRP